MAELPAAVFTAGDDVLAICFLREDIVRIRAGRANLPPDESWAVPGPRRNRQFPFTRRAGEKSTELGTGKLRVTIGHDTLALQIDDAAGRPLLTEAPHGGIRFEEQGFELLWRMPENAHYYGLGDKTGGLDRRDNAFVLWNTDTPFFGEATDPLYKAIPFVLEARPDGRAMGFFLDNHWRTTFDFGRSRRDTIRIGAEAGPVDFYVLAGPDAKSVLRQYNWLTGPAPLIPLWALGFQQSRWSYRTQEEAQGIADRLRQDRIPADALYLDIDYQDRKRPFTVSAKDFPDLPGFVARLREAGLRLVLITDLHIAVAPDDRYAPYESGTAEDVFVKNPDGTAYTGEVWPGPSHFPDFSVARVREWWGRQYAGFAAMGVAGFWNDMNEPSVFHVPGNTMPEATVHRIEEPGFATRRATHAEMHNVVGMLNSRATYAGLLKHSPEQRPFVLTRASAAGGQRYAATWTGDNVSTWAHLDLSIAMIANLGLSGFAYSGADVGGFGGLKPSPDLLTRWIQIGAFTPVFRDHCITEKPGQEPWVDGEHHTAIRRRAIEARYRLMPYLYGLAEENSRTGLPILRPVCLEFPRILGRRLGRNVTAGAFMLGPSLLIAPSPAMESDEPYRVSLPGGGWTDYWTGARTGAGLHTIHPSIEVLPVFVRPGAMIPRQELVQSTAETPSGNLRLEIYPGPAMRCVLYADDGISFAYRRGAFYRREITCVAQDDGYLVQFAAREGDFHPWWPAIDIVVHGAGGAVFAEAPDAATVAVAKTPPA